MTLERQELILPVGLLFIIYGYIFRAFSAYSDVYVIWDVITYCTVNKDYIIPQQYINKAVSLLITCMDTYILTAAISWLQKSSTEQFSNINEEVYFSYICAEFLHYTVRYLVYHSLKLTYSWFGCLCTEIRVLTLQIVLYISYFYDPLGRRRGI